MTCGRFPLTTATALLLLATAPAYAQRQTERSAEAVDSWVGAVKAHVPGRPDPSVARIVAMNYEARLNLNTGYSFFIRALREREVVDPRRKLDAAVAALANAVRTNPGMETFLTRAAMLHTDAAVFARKFPRPPDDAPWSPRTEPIAGRRSAIAPTAPPPLLTSERYTQTLDGEVIGDSPADWNLPFARSLFDELLRSGTFTKRELVGEWYHATAAFLFAQGMNGDARSHLRQASVVLPDDPRLLFDRASYAETFGLPIYQAVQEAAAAPSSVSDGGIPSEDKTNAEAERLYRRALEIRPDFLEARVRLARLLDRRGRHDDAAAEIRLVLEARPGGVVGFYSLIVAGRVATSRQRYEEALRHYRDASALFPAQSALLGASHAALMLADLPGTMEPIAHLTTKRNGVVADPWQDYQLGAGRDVNALLRAMWSHVPG